MGGRTTMDTDKAASELAIPRLTEEVSTQSARAAELDRELTRLAIRSTLWRAADFFAAVVLGVSVFGLSVWAGIMLFPYASGLSYIDDNSTNDSPLALVLVVLGLICLFGLALAVIAAARWAPRGWTDESGRPVECNTKKRLLTSERDSALTELGRKQAELEHHRRVAAMEPGAEP
jgi:hypothetical protein